MRVRWPRGLLRGPAAGPPAEWQFLAGPPVGREFLVGAWSVIEPTSAQGTCDAAGHHRAGERHDRRSGHADLGDLQQAGGRLGPRRPREAPETDHLHAGDERLALVQLPARGLPPRGVLADRDEGHPGRGAGRGIHFSDGDPYPGHSSGSHGCVHLSMANAKWFYAFVRQGGPVTISGSPRAVAPPDNGYADYDLKDWNAWTAPSASGTGPFTTTTPA